MPQSDPAVLDSTDWVKRYEAVRERALQDGVNGCGWGLALLMDRGLIAWMRAWPAASVGRRDLANSAEYQADSNTPLQSTNLPSTCYQQLAGVLASMILEARREVVQ
jgi:hypothetical protein